MKKYLLISSFLLIGLSTAFAQQKVKDNSVTGSNLANKDAILELESSNKGLLYSKVALKATTNASPLTAHVMGMMVYNTETISDVVPGIYYNDGSKWILAGAGLAANIKYDPKTYTISYIDPDNKTVSINLKNVVRENETLTTLANNNDGTYQYVSENGTIVLINVPADVIKNFESIANNNTVKEIIEKIVKKTGGNVSYDGTNFTYVDNTDKTQKINIDQIIKDKQLTETIVDGVSTEVISKISNGKPNNTEYKVEVKNGGISTLKLADGSVKTDKLGADAVTSDKIKDGEIKAADLADKTITGDKISDKTIGSDKLISDVLNKGKVPVVQADGTVVYQDLPSSSVTGKDLTAGDGSILVTDGKGATLINSNVKVADGGISTLKLADGSVKTDKLGADAVTSDKIKDGEIKAADLADKTITGDKVADKTIGSDKLISDVLNKGKVPVVQADGTVVYQDLPSSSVTGKDLTAGDGSILVTDGKGATLINSNVKVADGGISTLKLADGSVKTDKLGADAVTSDKIKDGEVKTADLADKTITGDKVADKTIGSDKLISDALNKGKVPVVQADGTVVYQDLPSSSVTGKDLTAGDGSILVTDGKGATLINSNVKVADGGISTLKLADGSVKTDKLGADAVTSDKIKDGEVKAADLADKTITGDKVADKTIGSDKLISDVLNKGKVPVVQADGTVVYQDLPSSSVTGKDLTAGDGSILVTDGKGATLINSNVKVADGGISTLKLADGSVKTDKLGADAVTSDKIKDGEIKAADLADKTITGDKVADKTIGSDKLISDVLNKGKVPVVQADGTVVYQDLPSSSVTGKDLTAGDGSILVTDGKGATLINSNVKVADGGISTLKLADGSVKTDKLGADAVTSDKIKDGEIKAADLADKTITGDKVADKTIGSDKLISDVLNKGKVPVVQADGTVVYQDLPSSSVTGKDLTAGDGSILVTDGKGATLINSNVKVADGGISTLKLADGSVKTDKLGADAVTSDKIKDGEVKAADLADKSITTDKLADNSVTAEKLKADKADKGKVATVNDKGEVVYSTPVASTSGLTNKKDINTDGIILVNGLKTLSGSVLEKADLSIAANSITIDKLKGDVADKGKVATVNDKGEVVYSTPVASTSGLTNKKDINTDGIILVNGLKTLSGSVLEKADLSIAANSITIDKLKGDVADKGKVATVNDKGEVVYSTPVASTSGLTNKKDINTDGIILVNGLKTLSGSVLEKADLSIAANSITIDKLKGDVADKGKVATVNDKGEVVYSTPVASTSGLTNKKDINTDGIILVNGLKTLSGSVLEKADLSIAANSITIDKLKGDVADKGKVATVNDKGEVVYSTPVASTSGLTNKKDINTDGIILVNGLKTLSGSVLEKADLSIAANSITIDKLKGDVADKGKVATVNDKGEVVYSTPVASASGLTNKKDINTDGIILVNGLKTLTGSVLEKADLSIAANSITIDKLKGDVADKGKVATVNDKGEVVYSTPVASASGLTNKKDINTDGIILVNGLKTLSGSVLEKADLSIAANSITIDKLKADKADVGKVATVDNNGNVTYIVPNAINADNGLAKSTASNIQLGGALTKATTIATGGSAIPTYTLAISGLQPGATTDKIVVADPNSGVLKQVRSAMPKFFYMPSMLLSTETVGQEYTVNLYNEYKAQFTGIPANQRSSATADIPFIPNVSDLDYYVTYYDTAVIQMISVLADGTMKYKVLKAATATSFVNIVFVVK